MAAAWTEVSISIISYVICSSLMLLVNKVVITKIPLPACVFSVQLAAAVAFVLVTRALGWITVDELTSERLRRFMPYVVLFVLSVYCNGRALAVSNAETVIVFRASTPLFVSALDVIFLGRQLPSRQSVLALCGVVVGAVGYMDADSELKLKGISTYFWVAIYTFAIILEMTYGKFIMSTVKFDTPVWGSVWFTNLLALPPMFCVAFASKEIERVDTVKLESLEISLLAVSCCIGTGISWAGWNCRGLVSATSFTLVGVVCKLITVILNVLVWNKHATPVGILWLLVCLFSSFFYKQSPLRESPPSKPSAMPAEHQLGRITNGANTCDSGDKSPDRDEEQDKSPERDQEQLYLKVCSS